MQKTSVIPTGASAERRNPPRCRKNQHKIKLATWEDSSTRIRSLGMTWRGAVPFNCTGYIRNVASPGSGLAGGRLPPLHSAIPLRPLFLQCFTLLCNPLRLGCAEPALPEGEPRGGAWYRSTARVIFGAWRAASSRPYGRGTIHPHRVYSLRSRNGT